VLNALKRLWTVLFLAVLHFPVAAVVSGLAGAQTGLTFWMMGIAAHRPVLSVTKVSFRRRLAVWLTAMTVGSVTAGLGALAIGELTQTTADHALGASGQVTNVFWFVAAIRLAITWAPVMVAWVVSGILVRRSGLVASVVAATRRNTQELESAPSVTREELHSESQHRRRDQALLRERTTGLPPRANNLRDNLPREISVGAGRCQDLEEHVPEGAGGPVARGRPGAEGRRAKRGGP